jgi:tetratricopeptide (TPR) repeat protein
VPVYYVGCERGIHFYAMQFIDGQTLADLIRELRRPAGQASAPEERTTAHTPAEEIVDPKADTEPAARQSTLKTQSAARSREFFRRAAGWGVQAAEALDHAHQAAIVHRDIKPGNLLLDGRGQLWVADFGLAHVRQGEAGLTLTGDLVGTLRYMSPEQALAKRVPIDHRTDVYSLGATLYELLTLRPALTGKDRQELLRQIAFEEPTPPRRLNKAIPPELEIIVLKAMEKNPAERYATAQEMADDLRRFLEDKPIRARWPSWRQVAARWARRHRPLVWATSTVFFLAAVLGGVNLWYVEQRQAETERAVGEHLQRAADFQSEEHWEEARQELGRAEERLAGGGPVALAERLRTIQMNAAMVADLDEAALQLAYSEADKYGLDGADQAYAAAFSKRGMDFAALAPEEAATRIRGSAVRARLVTALDDWASIKEGARRGSGERQTTIAQLVDEDPWRQRLRTPAVRQDVAALEGLAREVGILAQPPTNIVLLGRLLYHAGGQAAGESLLRRGQQRYPAHFWIHFELLRFLVLHRSASERTARLAESIGCLRAALALRPSSAPTRSNLGTVLNDLGKLDEAETEFREAIVLKPEYAEAHDNLCNVLLGLGRLDEAEAECRKAIVLKPEYAKAHASLGNTLWTQGHLQQAEAECRRALVLKPDLVEAHSYLGGILLSLGKLDQAEAECRKAIDLKPDLADAHAALGNILLTQRHLQEAEAECRRAVALRPDLAMAHLALGNALKEQGKSAAAEVECRNAIDLKPNYAEAHANLGNLLSMQRHPEEAEAECRKAIALKPDLVEAHANLGAILLSLGKLDDAEAECRKAVSLKPDFAGGHANLSVLLEKRGKLDDAEAECRKAVTLIPGRADIHAILGQILLKRGKLDEAEAEYRKAVALKPDFAEAYNRLGIAYIEEGRLDEAIEEFHKAIALNPDLVEAHFNLGNVLHDKGKPDEAEAEYRKAIALKPDFGNAHEGLGSVFLQKGRLDEALAEFRKAVALKPDLATAHFKLGNVLLNKGKLVEAVTEYRKAIGLKPDMAEAHANLGGILVAQGKVDEGISELRKHIELRPDSAIVHIKLGLALRQQGHFSEALVSLKRGHELGVRDPRWSLPSAQMIRETERIARLDALLPVFLKGEAQPTDAAVAAECAFLCQTYKHQYAGAVRFYKEAFAAESKLAENLNTGHRYNAVCAAALAGCGRGEDVPAAEADRVLLRAQALKWLQADLAAWKPQTKSLFPAVRTQAVTALAHWREDDDLAGVRDADALMKLPEGERADWQKLWADLDALLPKTKP